MLNWLLGVWQSLAVVMLSSAADEASPADFWAHYNIVSYKYLLKYLGARYQSVGAVCDSQFRQ